MNKLEQIRKEKGYTQEELAEKANVLLDELNKFETDLTYIANASSSKLIRIAKILNCSFEDLFTAEELDKLSNL